ncbi:hypothetical protein EXS65_03150 [Candidatus Peribacteria bacterium]|nr:hypothetical protein [Candidatus Peribacteria bacterium]
MTTQVSFIADLQLKNRALEKAKSQGITLKAFLTYAMKGFVDGTIRLTIDITDRDIDVEELHFEDELLQEKAKKMARLLH